MKSKYLFTSESVSAGHPDKICDQISDAIVDAYLTIDPNARVAAETLATTNRIVIAGETRSSNGGLSKAEIEKIARNVVKEIGYEQDGFHHENMDVEVLLHDQSTDISMGVDACCDGEEGEGAGDQGIMLGFACDETEDLMPATLHYSHRILENIIGAVKKGEIKNLGPDAKSQVTISYEDGKPIKVDNVLVSIQHKDGMTVKEIKETIYPYIKEVFPKDWMCEKDKLLVNPTGNFVIGGPDGDAGLTGRKVIVDTYGGAAPHGGGAFSGKDPSKVDRSATYMVRYLAKNVVAAGLAKKCTIQISYAIGVAKPLSFYLTTHGTGTVDDDKIAECLCDIVDLTPRGIRKHLQLNKPIYQRTAAYGHFGRKPDAEGGFSWEKTDLVDKLKEKLL